MCIALCRYNTKFHEDINFHITNSNTSISLIVTQSYGYFTALATLVRSFNKNFYTSKNKHGVLGQNPNVEIVDFKVTIDPFIFYAFHE